MQRLISLSTFPVILIIIAFSACCFSVQTSWHQKEADSEDFSFEGYQEALEEYNDSVALQATLCCVGRLDFSTQQFSIILGQTNFLVRMATSEISIVDMLTLFGTLYLAITQHLVFKDSGLSEALS